VAQETGAVLVRPSTIPWSSRPGTIGLEIIATFLPLHGSGAVGGGGLISGRHRDQGAVAVDPRRAWSRCWPRDPGEPAAGRPITGPTERTYQTIADGVHRAVRPPEHISKLVDDIVTVARTILAAMRALALSAAGGEPSGALGSPRRPAAVGRRSSR
jgi:threonine dehydratase